MGYGSQAIKLLKEYYEGHFINMDESEEYDQRAANPSTDFCADESGSNTRGTDYSFSKENNCVNS